MTEAISPLHCEHILTSAVEFDDFVFWIEHPDIDAGESIPPSQIADFIRYMRERIQRLEEQLIPGGFTRHDLESSQTRLAMADYWEESGNQGFAAALKEMGNPV